MSIQSLRDKSEGMLSKILIGLIIIVFGLFGFGSITTFLAPTPKVAEVNGEDISQQSMEMAVERNRRLMMARNQSVDEDELRATTMQNLITRELMLQEAEDQNLQVSEVVIDEEIVATEVFQINGRFDPEQFRLVIGGAGYTPVGYREEMRNDLRLQQMVSGIQNSAFMLPDEAARATALAQQTRDIAFLRIAVDDLMDDVTVEESEVQAYYDANPAEFMTEETVDLAYLELKRAEMKDEVEVSEADLQQYFEETRARYRQEENRRIAHILIETNDDVTTAQAEEQIDAIYERLLDGEDFSELARTLSDDPGSAAEGGDLGFNQPGTFVEAFEEVAYSLDRNQMSEPVETEFGFHIIKVLDIEPASEPVFAEVRDEVEEAFRELQAEEIFVERSARLSEIAFEAVDLQEPAAALDMEIRTTGPVTRSAEGEIAGSEEVMEAAYSPDVLVDGNNSRLIEITPNHHVVVRVREHSPQEIQPLDTVRSEVAETLKREKATALAVSQAKEAVAMLEDGSITRFVADQFGLAWEVVADAGRNQMGIDREIGTEAFRLPRPPEGQKSVGWASLSNGDAAVITVTRVTNKPVDQVATAELESFSRILATQQGGYDFSEFQAELRATADISRVN